MSDPKICFDLKRLSSDYLLVEDTGQVESSWICFRRNVNLTPESLNNYIGDILKCCLTYSVDSYKIHLNRRKGAKLIKKVAGHSTYSDLAVPQIIGLIWSSISVVHHFHIRVIAGNSYIAWYRRRAYKRAIYIYEKLLLMLLPNLFNTVIQALITFFNESRIWNLESLIAILLRKVLEICKDNENVIKNLLDIVEESETLNDARCVLRVIYSLLNVIDWLDIDMDLVARMLELYRYCTITESLETLKSGYEVCIKHLLQHMTHKDVLKSLRTMLEWAFSIEASENEIIEFGNLLEYAATLKKEDNDYYVTVTEDLLPLIMDLIASENMFMNLLGCRVLFFMMDRHKNQLCLMTPKPFFKDVKTNLNLAKLRVNDKRFLQNNHEILQTSLMMSIVNHGDNQVNLETTFACIALIAVEVPCGYTAASSVCFAMTIQEYALLNHHSEKSYNIHACVMFIMTLLCYIHHATVFYEYVNTILSRRAQIAPYLNPPIGVLNPSDGHYFNYNPELFFEDWEARYGLWKCFISRDDAI